MSSYSTSNERGRINRLRSRSSLQIAGGLALLCCGAIHAGTIPAQGTILGIFSNPVLTGFVANSPSLGQVQYFDNTATAVAFVNNSTDPAVNGSALVWGASAGNSGPNTFSILAFVGAQIPADINQPFQFGYITFLNGTSDLTSLIFAATLSFYDNTQDPNNFLGSDQVIITTTSNISGDTSLDADYINICGASSNICATSIKAVEASQGGSGLTVALQGAIVGDPVLFINGVSVTGGQTTAGNGLLGTDPPLGVSPEPGTLALFPVALLLGLAWRRRRNAN